MQHLGLRPGLMTPHIADMGVAHRITPYITEKSQSHRRYLPKSQSHHGILPKSQGHKGFSGKVTRSQPNFRWSQIVTPVVTVSIVHIGVTTPCIHFAVCILIKLIVRNLEVHPIFWHMVHFHLRPISLFVTGYEGLRLDYDKVQQNMICFN